MGEKEADGIIYMSLRPESMCETVRLCDTVEDYDAWDHFVFNLPRAHYFQTYGWLKSYEFMGFMPHVLVQESNGMITNGVAFLDAKNPIASLADRDHSARAAPSASRWLQLAPLDAVP